MDSQNNYQFSSSNNINSKNQNPEYPSLSKLNIQESAGDMTYNAQGSKIQNNTIRKDANYYMINNSTNSIYDEKYDSNKYKNYIPPAQNMQNNYNINNSDKYNVRYDSNQTQNKNNNMPNMPYPQQYPKKQPNNYNKAPNYPYNKNINAVPPVYPQMPIAPGVYPAPGIVGQFVPIPGDVEPIIQLRGPGFYPPPTIIPDFYPY